MMRTELQPANVTVVIVTYQSRQHIHWCLASVVDSSDFIAKIIVVDNGSTDGTVETIRRDHPTISILAQTQNLGFAKAVNIGAAMADTPYILLLNPDTEIPKTMLETLLTVAIENPEYALVTPRTVNSDGTENSSNTLRIPSLWTTALFSLGVDGLARRLLRVRPDQRRLGRERGNIDLVEVEGATGAALLVTTRAWRDLGGFNEAFFLYDEDTDLSVRARRLGYRIGVALNATIVHHVGGSSASGPDRLIAILRARMMFFEIHFRPRHAALARGLTVVGVAMRAGATRFRPFTAGTDRNKWREASDRRAEWAGSPGVT